MREGETGPANRAPGFLLASRLVAAKDLRMEWRTLESLSAMFLFSLVVLVVFNFAFDLATIQRLGPPKLVPGVLWITIAFSAIVRFTRSFQVEQRRDSLTALLQAPVDRGSIFLGKAAASLTLIWVLQAVLLPLSAVFFNFDLLAVLGPLLLVIAIHTVGLAELGTLFAAVASRVGRGEALLAILLLPMSAPLFLSAVRCSAAVLEGQSLGSVSQWLVLAVGLDFLYLFGALLTFEFVLEE
jgi:heme exporter protein B